MYDRTIDGEVKEFGALGIETGTLMLYDAETKSKWSQLMGHAVSGPLSGKQLDKIDVTMTSWKKWKALHPDTTAYIKRNVRVTDFSEKHFASLAGASEEGRLKNFVARTRHWFAVKWSGGLLQPTDLVIGVQGDDRAKAYLVSYLAKARVVNDALDGRPIVVAMSDDYVTARVYDRRAEGKTLTFALGEGDELTDAETGSVWSLMTGEAIAGPLQGTRLRPVVSTSALWFAWRKYRPETDLVGAP